MTYGHIKELESADALRQAGYIAVCYAAYAHDGFARGEIISRHKTLRGACKAAGGKRHRDMKSWREVPLQGPLD